MKKIQATRLILRIIQYTAEQVLRVSSKYNETTIHFAAHATRSTMTLFDAAHNPLASPNNTHLFLLKYVLFKLV